MRRPRLLLGAATLAFAAGFSALAVLQHRAFSTGRFDLGNMTQAIWSTAHGRPLEITDLSGTLALEQGIGRHSDFTLSYSYTDTELESVDSSVARSHGLVRSGERYVMVYGARVGVRGATNAVRVEQLP